MTGVLWVTGEVPDRNGGGGNLRQGYLLRALAEHVPVDLLVAGEVRDDGVRDATRTLVEIPNEVAMPSSVRAVRRVHAATTAWVRRAPLDVSDHRRVRDDLAARIATMATNVDTVLVHHQSLGPLLAGPRFGRARWVLTLFHAAADRAEQAARVERNALQRALLRRDGANARRAEAAMVDLADALVVVSHEDRARLARPGTPVHVVPNGVDVSAFPPSSVPPAPTVLLAGSLDYAPNVDGAVWFAADVWPRIRAEAPDAQLLVVGRHPVATVAELHGRDGIEVHPDVPDIVPWFTRARVAVVPLRIGTGSRLKAMQALAAGRPVVGTTIGMEGLSLTSDEADVEDDPSRFAAAVVTLLRDDGLAQRRADRGREFAERQLSWTTLGDQLFEALS
jgi:glycosyltransferase involved in cell wall biosynthesis